MRLRNIARVLGLALFLSMLLVILVPSVAGQEKQGEGDPAAPPPASQAADSDGKNESGRPALQKRGYRYQLRPGDVLQINFPFTPEFNQTASVQPDGYVTLRGVGDLHVEGLTKPELTKALLSAFSKFLNEPVIVVEMKDFEKPYFIAGGELARPGKYELRGDTTVSQAVAMAGGFRDSAKHSQVVLFRKVSSDWAETKLINVKEMLKKGNLTEDIHLQPGDMLFVPKSSFSKIKPFIPVPGLGAYFNPGML
jgi:polysaccharide export outer membrane protein